MLQTSPEPFSAKADRCGGTALSLAAVSTAHTMSTEDQRRAVSKPDVFLLPLAGIEARSMARARAKPPAGCSQNHRTFRLEKTF